VSEPWTADIEVTADLVRALLMEQFPHLGSARIEPLGEGWDNAAFLVADRYVFRFPRRAIAAPLIAREIAILPMLAPNLPLAISAPCFAGIASGAYPWRFAGYRSFRGQPLSATSPGPAAYVRLAATLGTFLGALHRIDPAPAIDAGLPGDEIGRLDHAQRMSKLEGRFAALCSAGFIRDVSGLLEFLRSVAPSGPRTARSAIVHGDLYAKHVVVDAAGNVDGIIDWGDVHYGDPAIDVSIAYEILPPHARQAFAGAYGVIDEETWRLARYRAIYHAALVAHYGYRTGSPETLAAGLAGLEYATP